jgi:hypothetical protein
MNADERERDKHREDAGERDVEHRPEGEPQRERERDETEVDPEAGENPS